MAGSQGRRSATHSTLVLGMIGLLLCSHVAESATYIVGDSAGWTFNMVSWPNGKQFRTGDNLVFKYDPAAHNVVVVSSAGYNGCMMPSGSREYRSGNDSITLAKGTSYFICSIAGHCQAGMKIAVTAT